jgi:hypothetical protein
VYSSSAPVALITTLCASFLPYSSRRLTLLPLALCRLTCALLLYVTYGRRYCERRFLFRRYELPEFTSEGALFAGTTR